MRGWLTGVISGVAAIFLITGANAFEDPIGDEVSAFDAHITDSKRAMMRDPGEALKLAKAAEAAARNGDTADTDERHAIATAYWLQAEALNRLAKPDDAAPLVDRAVALLDGADSGSSLFGNLVLARARIARVRRDDALALSSFHAAHDIFSALGSTRYQAIALQGLGSIYLDARDYDRVLHYYEQASEIHKNDPALDLASFNNRANAYRELGDYSRAISLSEQAFGVAKSIDSKMLMARTKSTTAATLVLAGRNLDAVAAVDEAQGYLSQTEDSEWFGVVEGVRGQALAAMGQNNEAVAVFDAVFAGRDLTTTNSQFRDHHEAAYLVNRAVGRHAAALAHAEAFHRLDDSAREVAASASNILMAAEFDFANQEIQIANLETAQLRNEFALREAEARQNRILLTGGFSLAVLIVAALVWGLLQMSVHRRTMEKANVRLARSNQALEKANRAKTAFLATTSHEIRTPLNGILGLTQILIDRDDVTGKSRDHIHSIRSAGETLLAVVSDILDVSTIESGEFRVEEAMANVPKMVAEVVELFERPAAEQSVEITVDVGNCPEALLTDAQRLRQVVFNLVSNAVKFTQHGSVHVALSTAVRDSGERLVIDVSDTGIGIPPDQLDAIFDTFHQVDQGRTRQFGGTGLGLAICKKISRALGGDINVVSVFGEGARFTVEVNLKRIQDMPRQTPCRVSERSVRAVSDLDVLVVEDNVLNRTVIQALIEKQVKSVTLTEDGVQALSAMEQKHFDLILMDKQMPRMDGITATQKIRAMSNGDEAIYIVAVTADAYEGAREELIDAGCDDYLAKPVSVQGLTDALERAVARGVFHDRDNELDHSVAS